MELRTEYLRDEVARCESIDELRDQIFPLLRDQSQAWTVKVNEIIAENDYTKTAFASACGVSRVTVDKWCKGAVPKNRETFLKIGMAAHYDRDEMNRLLVRNGRYPALYAKTLEDCVCLYVLGQDYGEHAVKQYQDILERMRAVITQQNDTVPDRNMETVYVNNALSEVRDTDTLEAFVKENSAMFTLAYNKLYSEIRSYLEDTRYMDANNMFQLAESQNWSSSMRQCMSAINQNKWYPTRNKIISIGLHLSMDHEEIDDLLKLAYMEPLCAKNLFESVMIYVLEDADLNDLLNMEREDYDPDGLCRYAREVLTELDMSEMADFLKELPEDKDE